MLVCNVSLRAPRRTIVATIAEATTAADATATGNVVFATLVDDPANVRDNVDAYLGEIMLEAASAASAQDAEVPAVYAADITETGTAADSQDATAGVPTATWDTATTTNVTLSGGNLVTTSTGGSSTNQGAHVAAGSGRTTGKYYFETTLSTHTGGGNSGIAVGTPTSTYVAMGTNATTGAEVFTGTGNIYSNGSTTGFTISNRSTGNVIGCAIDLDNRKAWFRVAPAGNWNGNATHNPATNTGGVTIPAGTMIPFCTFNINGNVWTTNFGASAFTGSVPSGFTSGWPA